MAANDFSVLQKNAQGRFVQVDVDPKPNEVFAVTQDGATLDLLPLNTVIHNENSTNGVVQDGSLQILGRYTTSTGYIRQITLGAGLSFNGMVLNTAGGGGTSITETEIDFGSWPTFSKTFTIIDATVTTSSKINPIQSGKAATGKSADENELDLITFRAAPQTGSFLLFADAETGPVVGTFKVNYIVSN